MDEERLNLDELEEDDPRWDLPGVLLLRDGREAHVDGMSMRDLLGLYHFAVQDGVKILGQIDPDQVQAISFDESGS